MPKAIYDTEVGATYDSTRHADPHITTLLLKNLQPSKSGQYLDLGCGTGNYTVALANKGFNFTGLDLSEQMLEAARQKSDHVKWVQGSARKTPFESNTFDGILCTLALHLIGELEATVTEAYRLLKKGRFVIFTFTPDMIENYWLCHYFPKCMQRSAAKMHTEDELINAFNHAGFQNIQQAPYFVTANVQDSFLYSGKHNPASYLDHKIRANISAFSISNEADEIALGIAQLAKDIESGHITGIQDSYESKTGDCMILYGEKL